MSTRFACTVGLLTLLVGCNRNVYSPPARALPLESVATLPEGDTGVQLEGGVHNRLFGPSVLSGTARVRRGMSDDLDASIEATTMYVQGENPKPVRASRAIHALRAGVKWRFAKPLAMTAGVGGGYSAGGAFVSPEVGPIVAWENRYLVPFIATRLGVSQPIGARAVDVSDAQDDSRLEKPVTTWLATGVVGLRVPIGWAEPQRGTVRGSLLAGLGVTHLFDTRQDDTFGQLAVGGELVF
jgi:hypothetical protein